MKFINLFLVALLLTSCNKFKGNLVVTDHLQFYKGGKNDYLVEGNYVAKVKIKKSTINIKAKNKFQRSSIKLNIPKNVELPLLSLKKIHKLTQEECAKTKSCNRDFTFKLDALYLTDDQTGQPFDTTALILVHRQKSEITNGTESCAVLPNLQECQLNEYWRNNYSMCRDGLPGTRKVTYIKYIYDLDIDIYLTQDNSKKAQFSSSKNADFNEYLSVGPCTLN